MFDIKYEYNVHHQLDDMDLTQCDIRKNRSIGLDDRIESLKILI